MKEITLGTTLAKPVVTQEECDAYAAMAQAVNDHNDGCTVGDTLWTIEDGEDCYTVAEGGAVPEPEQPDPSSTTEGKIAALQEQNKKLAEQNEMLTQCLLEMSETVYA